MIYILENDLLKVKVSSMGAELQSIRRKDTDTEYLWQGNPEFWSRRAVNIFPICGRLVDGKYSYDGKVYEMGCHGFAGTAEWTVVHQKGNALTLQLQADDITLAQYPFRFAMEIAYTLTDDTLSVSLIVHNLDDKTMYFAVGGHPGFNVPLEEGQSFDDYYLEFDEPCHPQLVVLNGVFYSGNTTPYPLKEDKYLPLYHSLFDNEALFFANTAGGVTLRSKNGQRQIHMTYPDMKYVGLWQKEHTEAPMVSIEPWSGLPSLDIPGVVALQDKPEMTALDPQETYRNTYTMTFA
ncbi:MAG: aldose 1-epimerase family protein [Clostridia bacterium]|nr:aldose 1-epimerase family protein [Clostridia bacterium]